MLKGMLFRIGDFSKYTWVDFIREKFDTFDEFKKITCEVEKDHNLAKILYVLY